MREEASGLPPRSDQQVRRHASALIVKGGTEERTSVLIHYHKHKTSPFAVKFAVKTRELFVISDRLASKPPRKPETQSTQSSGWRSD